MKINLLLAISFLSIIIYASIDEMHGIVGLTKRDGGIGCICHNFSPTNTVNVWIEGPDSVIINSTVQYKLFITGGAAVAGGFDIAIYFGEVDSVDTLTKVIAGELTHTQPNPFFDDTVSWNFLYTAPNSILTDTIYSVGNSVNWDSIPSNLDQWNFGENFVISIIDNPVPVELSNFIATTNLNNVLISWTTLTETNNSGFEIERSPSLIPSQREGTSHIPLWGDWGVIGFVPGFGTTTEPKTYSFTDENVTAGTYKYRLKQIDFNGTFEYSNIIEVTVTVPTIFSLEQNYPNPFNPTTKIKFTIPQSPLSFGEGLGVRLVVYDILGNEIVVLVNEEKTAGKYEVEFVGSEFPSGIYFYKLETKGFAETRKMVLLK